MLRRWHIGKSFWKLRRQFSNHETSNIHPEERFDVLVIGGGHAGVEACAAAARMGAKTLLITHKVETIGEMSCNPSFGGIGKGHLIREIDALDGLCGRCCDVAGVHYKVLNKRRGPAVWGPRAQIDRTLYKRAVQEQLFAMKNLTICCASVDNLHIVPNETDEKSNATKRCAGVVLQSGQILHAETVVLATGTFLGAQIHIGLKTHTAGRMGDVSATALAKSLHEIGFRMGRLKTGTPPRIAKHSVDYKRISRQDADNPPTPFSFMNDEVWISAEQQLPCYLTETTPRLNKIVMDNLHLNRHVTEEVNGPRYCPSIESKIIRFGQKTHQVWLEPEGFDSDLMYPQGISCTLPEELQVELVRAIIGCETAEIRQPGYGVQYDYIDPREIQANLETKRVANLFFAGQINGTTGYEEAAAQGVVAGANAAGKTTHSLKTTHKDFVINRTEGYIGVLVDDLTTLGTNEPYRMFTSRAEFRLSLRPDNADLRLTQKGYDYGLVSEERYQRYSNTKMQLEKAVSALKSLQRHSNYWRHTFGLRAAKTSVEKSAFDILGTPANGIEVDQIINLHPYELSELRIDANLASRIKIEALYGFFVHEQQKDVENVRHESKLRIPNNIDYFDKSLSLSNEEREKLCLIQPQTIAAASRIQGVTPATVVRLLKYVKRSDNATAAYVQ